MTQVCEEIKSTMRFKFLSVGGTALCKMKKPYTNFTQKKAKNIFFWENIGLK